MYEQRQTSRDSPITITRFTYPWWKGTTMTKFTDELDSVHKRLLADVDDRMEFLGTVLNPKAHAAKQVAKALAEAREQILEAIDEALIGLEVDLEATREHMEAKGASENDILNMELEADDRKDVLDDVRQALGITKGEKTDELL